MPVLTRKRRALLPLLFAILLSAPLLLGATFTVTTAAETGAGSLRAAVDQAALSAGTDQIVFDPAVFNGEPGDVIQVSSRIIVNDPTGLVSINALAIPQGVVVSGRGLNRVFDFQSSPGALLRGVTIEGGFNAQNGGAVIVTGTARLEDCTIRNNSAGASGGGFHSTGTLTLDRCTLHGNTAAMGAGIHAGGGTLVMNQCTVSTNAAQSGGGVALRVSAAGTFRFCTVAENTASTGGGGLFFQSTGNCVMESCVTAGNTAPSGSDIQKISGMLVSTGTGFIGSNETVAAEYPAGPYAGTAAAPANARLAALAHNGGRTLTMLPLEESPLIDASATGGGTLFDTDQRGQPWRTWGRADIGAVEVAGAAVDDVWEVRQAFRSGVAVTSLAIAEALYYDPAATVIRSTRATVNLHDKGSAVPGAPGYFTGDDPYPAENLTVQGLVNGDDDHHATLARCWIQITAADSYTFGFHTDEEARLRIFNSDATQVLSTTNSLAVVTLTPGLYGVEFLCRESTGAAHAEVYAALGVKTAVDGGFRLVGDRNAPARLGHGTLTASAWTVEVARSNVSSMSNAVNLWGDFWTLRPVTQLRFLSANDFPDRDPMTFVLEGSQSSTAGEGPWVTIASGNTGIPTARHALSPRIPFNNSTRYRTYRLTFPTLRNAALVNSMQIGEVEFLDSAGNDMVNETASVRAIADGGSSFPPGEDSSKAIDNTTGKYLNFNKSNPGIEVIVPGDFSTITFAPGTPALTFTDPQNGSATLHGTTLLPFPGDGPGDDDSFTTGARCLLTVPEYGFYTFCVQAAGAVHFRIRGSRGWTVGGGGNPEVLANGFQTTAGSGDVFAQIALDAGAWEIEVIHLETTGAAHLAVWAAAGWHDRFDALTSRYFSPAGSNLTAIESAVPFSLVRSPALTRPPNDDIASATVLSGTSIIADARNTGATLEPGEPVHGGTFLNSVWWKWTAPADGWHEATLSASSLRWLTVYTGGSPGTLTEVESRPSPATPQRHRDALDPAIAFAASAGTTYWFQVSGFDPNPGKSEFPLRLSLSAIPQPAPPVNDDFAAATHLGTVESFHLSGYLANATREAGEPDHEPNFGGGDSIWFTWTAPVTGTWLIDAQGSDFFALLAVYAGESVDELTTVGIYDIDDGAPLQGFGFRAIAGTTYRIALAQLSPEERGRYYLQLKPGIYQADTKETNEDTPAGDMLVLVENAGLHATIPDFAVTSSNQTLVPNAAIFSTMGNSLSAYTVSPARDLSGTATLTVHAQVDGMPLTSTRTLTVRPVNDAPVFTGTSVTALSSMTGPHTRTGWAKNISPGPADETGQTLEFTVAAGTPDLFLVPPSLSPDGTLTFTPVPGITGGSTLSVTLRDNGGTANGGQDISNGMTGYLFLSNPTPFTAWVGSYGLAGTSGLPGADPDQDGLNNLTEFASGLHPFHGSLTPLSFTGNTITPGLPVIRDGALQFIRRTDHADDGLTYTVEFSTNLTLWTAGATPPAVLADDGALQVVSLPLSLDGPRQFVQVNVRLSP